MSDLIDLNLPTRVHNALVKNGITTIKELKKTTNLTLSLCNGISLKSVRVIKKSLSDYGKNLKVDA
jgi:DNA-directed RNA polymerase alpha subunit